MNVQGILEKLNKLSIVNLNGQHQQTIDLFYKSTVDFVWKSLPTYKDIWETFIW